MSWDDFPTILTVVSGDAMTSDSNWTTMLRLAKLLTFQASKFGLNETHSATHATVVDQCESSANDLQSGQIRAAPVVRKSQLLRHHKRRPESAFWGSPSYRMHHRRQPQHQADAGGTTHSIRADGRPHLVRL